MDIADSGTRKLALLIEYNGEQFHGFQLQSNAWTVQAALEKALHTITGEHNRLQGASRTDAGVHAWGQVTAFTTKSAHRPETFVSALNFHLSGGAAVQGASEVDRKFDPRRDAISRSYRYVVLNRETPSPLAVKHSLWVRDALDVRAMHRAAQELVGRHDMASFSGPLSDPQKSTMRQVFGTDVSSAGEYVQFDIEANAFLPQQVRRTMGVLLAIGKGKLSPDSVGILLEHPRIGAADTPVPPQGLYLMNISYPEHMLTFSHRHDRLHSLPLLAGVAGSRE